MRRRSGVWVGAVAWVAVSIVVWGFVASWLGGRLLGEFPDVADTPEPRASSDEGGGRIMIPDRLARGETLSTVLERNGFTNGEVYEIARALSAIMDVRRLRAGDELAIRYDGSGEPSSIQIHRSDRQRVELTRSPLGWQSESEEVELTRKVIAVSGVLEGNLFASMKRLGEGAPLTIAFANVFAWDFDFHTESRAGDRFSLVVEKLYRDGEPVGYGNLRAARYVSSLAGGRVFNAFLYEEPSGKRDYYDADGKSMRKAFLRAPVAFERISSGFSYSRLHPIHQRRMPHLGVDYVARKGTPVYSVAGGVVTGRAFSRGNGNMVTVRHAMGFTTKYLHLSRFAKGLRVGSRVEQKQVIGYVGDTGWATAPHLDFRLIHHGKPVNPVTQIYPPGPPVADQFRSDFEMRKALLARQLEGPSRKRVAVALDDS